MSYIEFRLKKFNIALSLGNKLFIFYFFDSSMKLTNFVKKNEKNRNLVTIEQ